MSSSLQHDSAFAVGELVNVESRTWPGINKPGGVGKVSRIHTDESSYPIKVDVKYVLGGEEKEIELQYVKKHEDLARGGRARQRREVMNLGGTDEGRAKRSTSTPTAVTSVAAKSKKKRTQQEEAPAKQNKRRKSNQSASASTKNQTAPSPPSTDTSPGHFDSDQDSVVITDDEGDAAVSRKSVSKKKVSKKKTGKTAERKETKAISKQTKSRDKSVTTSNSKSKNEKGKANVDKASNEKMQKRTSLKEVGNKTGVGAVKETSKEPTALQKVHAINSRAASFFVDDVVGRAPVPASSSHKKTTIAGSYDQENESGGGSEDETLTVDVKRRQLFVSSLNDVMMKRMVDEMSIDEILDKVNALLVKGPPASSEGASLFQVDNTGGAARQTPFSNLEIRSFLNELDREQKIMVTWDSGTVYRI